MNQQGLPASVPPAGSSPPTWLPRSAAIGVFAVFAGAYFLSALVRAVTATLAPALTLEFNLQARDLGLLSGAYFLGFSLTQLPMGSWLDRHGPRRVVLGFLAVAVIGCLAFAVAQGYWGLFAARLLCGVGLSACLMAPLTGYRRWFSPAAQMRANSWMLMTGSMGMIAASLPVQWLLPWTGWRAIFVGLAAWLMLSMAWIRWRVPPWEPRAVAAVVEKRPGGGYGAIWRNPYFRSMAPIGVFCYGGLLAVQTLWAAPWMTRVGGYTPEEAALGLFWIHVCMLFTFWCWGAAGPMLTRRGVSARMLIVRWLPVSFLLLLGLIASARWAPAWSGPLLALYCMSCSVVTPAQPAVGMAFPDQLAGRALSAFNLLIFAGVFAIQWGIGLAADGFTWMGAGPVAAMQGAFLVYLALGVGAWLHLLRAPGDNPVAVSP